MFGEEVHSQAWPRSKVVTFDGTDYRGWDRAAQDGMHELCEIVFGRGHAQGTVGVRACCGRHSGQWRLGALGGKRDIPQASLVISGAVDDNLAVLDDIDIVFSEEGHTLIITQFANRD